MRRIRLGTDLRLAGVWDTVHLLEPLSADVRAHGARERSRAARTRSWMPVGADLFEVAPLDDCDVAVLPFAWEDAEQSPQRREQALAFFGRAASAGVATLVFSQSDRPQPVPRDDVVVFQHALHRSSLAPQYVALPAWIDDPFPDGLPAGLARQWTARPVVTFCGYAPPLGLPETPWPRRLVEAPRDRFRRMRCAVGIDERRGFSPPVFWRADTLRRLERDPRVDTAYVFRGGATKSMPIGPQPTDGTQASPREYRTAYVDNLLAGDYVVAVRGFGNYSYRFYEALSCGRVPLYVDTDGVLPLESTIDWRSLIAYVDRRAIPRVTDELLDTHHAWGPEGFAERQAQCRRVFDEHLSMPGFFRALHRRLVDLSAAGPVAGAVGARRLASAMR